MGNKDYRIIIIAGNVCTTELYLPLFYCLLIKKSVGI